MKKQMLSLLVVLVLALLLAAPVSAKPITAVEGEIIPTDEFSGVLTGPISGDYTIVYAQGNVSRLFFEGSVNGVTGTLYINLVNIGPQEIGYWTILSGTGDLADLHGQGVFTLPVDSPGSYSGQVH